MSGKMRSKEIIPEREEGIQERDWKKGAWRWGPLVGILASGAFFGVVRKERVCLPGTAGLALLYFALVKGIEQSERRKHPQP